MMRNVDGIWAEVPWKTVLDEMERRMRTGQGGAFGLVSSQCANEQLMMFRDLMQKGWDVDHLDTLDGRLIRTVTDAWKEISTNFLIAKEASWRRIPDADHILVIGSFDTQPLIGGLVRRAVLEKRSTVCRIGNRDTLSGFSSLNVPVSAGKESFIIQAFLSQAIKTPHLHLTPGWESILSGLVSTDVQGSLDKAGLEKSAHPFFMAAVEAFVQSRNPMIIAGKGILDRSDAGTLRNLMLLSLIKGVLPENALRLVILKPCGNSAGALKLRIPAESAAAGEWQRGVMLLEDETLHGSFILGRLTGLDFLAVITPYFPEALKDRAHVLIPRPTGLEEEGSYTSLDGQTIRPLDALLQRPEGVSESWHTLLALMQRTDFHPSYARWKDIRARVTGEMRS